LPQATRPHPDVRRRLFAAALLGLAAPRLQAMDALTVTAVSKTGGSGVAGRLLAEIYRRAGTGLSIEVMPAARASLASQSDQADGELMRIASYGQSHPLLVRVDASACAPTGCRRAAPACGRATTCGTTPSARSAAWPMRRR
jgi:hypothetical protein